MAVGKAWTRRETRKRGSIEAARDETRHFVAGIDIAPMAYDNTLGRHETLLVLVTGSLPLAPSLTLFRFSLKCHQSRQLTSRESPLFTLRTSRGRVRSGTGHLAINRQSQRLLKPPGRSQRLLNQERAGVAKTPQSKRRLFQTSLAIVSEFRSHGLLNSTTVETTVWSPGDEQLPLAMLFPGQGTTHRRPVIAEGHRKPIAGSMATFAYADFRF